MIHEKLKDENTDCCLSSLKHLCVVEIKKLSMENCSEKKKARLIDIVSKLAISPALKTILLRYGVVKK